MLSRNHFISIQYRCSTDPSGLMISFSNTPPFFIIDLADPILSLSQTIRTLSRPSFLHSSNANQIISVAYPFLLSLGLIPSPMCPPVLTSSPLSQWRIFTAPIRFMFFPQNMDLFYCFIYSAANDNIISGNITFLPKSYCCCCSGFRPTKAAPDAELSDTTSSAIPGNSNSSVIR